MHAPRSDPAFRNELRRKQTAVLSAVLHKDTTLPGFAARELEITYDALVRKRAWCVASAWPTLAHGLGNDFLEEFVEFARREVAPAAGGSTVDGWRFAEHLAAKGALPDVARVQKLGFDLTFFVRDGRAIRRRAPTLRVDFLRRSRRIVFALRLTEKRSVCLVVPPYPK
jgi:hypothetical protein